MGVKVWENDMIGVLAESDPFDLSNRDTIIINKQDSLQYFIKIISQPAASFPNVKTVTGFYSDLERWGFEDDYRLTDFERKNRLREWLEDRLFVFKVEKRLRYNHEEVFNAIDVRIISKLPSFHTDLKLIPVPVFNKEAHHIDKDEFLFRLYNKKFVGKVENLSHEPDDTPSLVMWREEGEEDDQFSVFGEIDHHQHAHGGFNFEIHGELKEVGLTPEWIEECYFSDEIPNIVFVPLELYKKLTTLVEQAVPLNLEKLEKEEANPAIEQTNKVQEDPKKIPNVQMQAEAAATLQVEGLQTPDPDLTPYNAKENEFLDKLFTTTRDFGFVYEKKDLINFHTCMKSSSLVILSGMSGTGKTNLVELYSHALGLKGIQYTLIPVSPSWTSDSDLIGYADTLHMVYRPGDSGLINALRKAEDEKDKLFIICFDEMNLARVEHYFSQFLSILEMDHGKRVLRLYNDDLESRLYNSAQYPPTIAIRENVLFVGTVNVDESTYHFSDKVLDRANVLSLEIMPFEHMKKLPERKKNLALGTREVDFETFTSFKADRRNVALMDEELKFLWNVHQALHDANKQIGVGPRIVKQIDAYLANLPVQDVLTREQAFDLQMVQRILTKLRGSEDQLRELAGIYDKETGEVNGSILLNLFDQHQQVSDFEKSREIVKQKAKELKLNGYTI